MASEILDRLPKRLRRFLLWTSVFDTLEASGCDTILCEEGAARLLETLERRNVPMMRVQGDVAEYRVHPLFRDFLRNELRLRTPELHRTLSQRAGAWQADRGRASEAIWHFAQAEDWEQVTKLIQDEAPRAYKLGKWHMITSWLQIMPANELRERPQLRLWEARILVRLAQADAALRVIDEAVGLLEESGSVTLAQFETIRAMALRVKGDVGWALPSSQRAVDLAVSANAPMDVVAEAGKQLGIVQFVRGSFAEAAKELRRVLDIYEQRGDIEETAFVSGCLGSALASLGRLTESVTHLEEARRQWRKVGNIKELSWVLNNLGMVYHLMGQLDLARELFLDALSKAQESGHQRAQAYALISLADIDRESGDQPSALERYEDARALAADLGDMTLSTHALTGLSRTCRRMGDVGKAEVLARQALAGARERDSAYEQGLAQVALGRLWRQQGKLDDATSALAAAVSLFEGAKAKKELAEALFYLAESSLPVRRGRSLLRVSLERLAEISRELGHDYFLTQAAQGAPAVVQFGASRRIGGDFYRELLRRSVPRVSAIKEPPVRKGIVPKPFPTVEVLSLGDVEVRMEGRKVLDLEWESEKSKELFLLLLVNERPFSRDEAVAALWTEAGGSRASRAFHSTLHRVRRALYAECVVESGGAYALNPGGSFPCDVRKFERLAEAARTMAEDDPSYVSTLRAAIDLHRGPFAPSVESEWADARRLRLEQRFLEVAAKLGDKLLRMGDQAGAIQACQRLLEHDPYNEAACYKLMKAYAGSGDNEAALHTFRRFREELERDIGEKPGRAIAQLYFEVRDQLGRTTARPP
jgi:ATP/maltotriose-dependent transcriptional regulator MalT